MQIDETVERAKFEAYATNRFPMHIRDKSGSLRFGEYVSAHAQSAWEAWLERAKAMPERDGDALAKLPVVGWAWVLVDERTGEDYDIGFIFDERKPNLPARKGTHYDYAALIGRNKALRACGSKEDVPIILLSSSTATFGSESVDAMVDREQSTDSVVQEVSIRGEGIPADPTPPAPVRDGEALTDAHITAALLADKVLDKAVNTGPLAEVAYAAFRLGHAYRAASPDAAVALSSPDRSGKAEP